MDVARTQSEFLIKWFINEKTADPKACRTLLFPLSVCQNKLMKILWQTRLGQTARGGRTLFVENGEPKAVAGASRQCVQSEVRPNADTTRTDNLIVRRRVLEMELKQLRGSLDVCECR